MPSTLLSLFIKSKSFAKVLTCFTLPTSIFGSLLLPLAQLFCTTTTCAKFVGNETRLFVTLLDEELFTCIGVEKNKDEHSGVNDPPLALLAVDEFEIVEGEIEIFPFSGVVESGRSVVLGLN